MNTHNRLKIIFAGTPEFAAHHLQTLLDSEHDVIAVYTQPDRPAGRGKKLAASPVKELAIAHDVAVFQPKSLKTEEAQEELRELHADIMVVVAYGLILPKAVLDIPPYGCINVHASLLPRWRGAAPIQRALAAGDTETGVTIMQMDVGLDTGDMLVTRTCPILPTDTGGDLHDRLLTLGGPALLEALTQIALGTSQPQAQDDALSCYASKMSKEEACINWSQPAPDLDRMIRAFNPFPVAYFTQGKDNVRVWQATPLNPNSAQPPGTIIAASNEGIEVSCGEGSLLLQMLQVPGKKAMLVSALLNGYRDRFTVGKLISSDPSL